MFFAKYILKDRLLKLSGLNKTIKESQTSIDIELGRFYGVLYDIRLALEECICAYSKPRLYQLILNSVKITNKSLDSIKTAVELKQAISDAVELFEDYDYAEHSESDLTYSYKSLYNIKSMEVEALDPIVKEVTKIGRNVTLFEPNCGQGDAFQYMENDKLMHYGIEKSNDIALAKEHAFKVVKGEIRGSKIKNDAFDVLIAKCSIKSTLAENMTMRSTISKPEKEFMYGVNKYVRTNGIVMFMIPYYRMYKDICDHIAKNYTNINIYKATGAYWQEKKYVYIYCQKSATKEVDEDGYNKLRKSFNPSLITEFNSDIELNYRMPQSYIEIDCFKGSVLDMDELHDIVNLSGAMDSFFESQKIEKIGDGNIKPLLPFNIGQLGLVLTSGCLDGIIDEGDGNFHLVKGKVSKKSEIKSSVVDGIYEESETISNRVEINILLPNGEYKILT